MSRNFIVASSVKSSKSKVTAQKTPLKSKTEVEKSRESGKVGRKLSKFLTKQKENEEN